MTTGRARRASRRLMMWVLIASEMLVFGAGLLAFLAMRADHPAAFAADQAMLDQTAGALNTSYW